MYSLISLHLLDSLLLQLSGKDENTFAEPEKVVPTSTECNLTFKESLYLTPANSLTVWRMKLKK